MKKSEGWVDTVLVSDFPEVVYQENDREDSRWTEYSAQPTPAPIRNIDCEYDGYRGGRCTAIHKECSDLAAGGSAS